MFDAIEDIPTEKLVAELLSRTPSNLAVALVEIADELNKGEDADMRWLWRQASVVTLAASVIQS
tara:strand:- start:245 stop:436 length:192 start_codon:yes stop_codon:yes gene_type:complete